MTAFFKTWADAMLRPQTFWSTVRPQGPWLDALTFAWIASAVSQLLQLPMFPVTKASMRNIPPEIRERLEQLGPQFQKILDSALEQTFLGAVTQTVSSILLFPIGLFILAAVLHLFCLMVGAAKNEFWATFRVCGYAMAPMLLGWIPCVNLVAGLYVVVQLVLGIEAAQGTTTGRATAAVLLPVVLLCCCCCLAMGAIASVVAATLGSPS